jgi:hypothetical protein
VQIFKFEKEGAKIGRKLNEARKNFEASWQLLEGLSKMIAQYEDPLE